MPPEPPTTAHTSWVVDYDHWSPVSETLQSRRLRTLGPLENNDPERIGRYRLIGRLGAGGMGQVFFGRSAGGRAVAVKRIHPHMAADASFRERFAREVRAARQVSGAFTAPVLDAGPDDEVPWLVTS